MRRINNASNLVKKKGVESKTTSSNNGSILVKNKGVETESINHKKKTDFERREKFQSILYRGHYY